jgi:Protein of unknown function, DUF417
MLRRYDQYWRASKMSFSVIEPSYIAISLERIGAGVLRLGLVVVLLWIGGLKAADYEARGIAGSGLKTGVAGSAAAISSSSKISSVRPVFISSK